MIQGQYTQKKLLRLSPYDKGAFECTLIYTKSVASN